MTTIRMQKKKKKFEDGFVVISISAKRTELMDDDKIQFVQKTSARTLGEIIENADVFLGLSAGGVLKPEMVKKMAAKPLILALAKAGGEQRLDLGCVAAHGIFGCDTDGCQTVSPIEKPATAFLLELIALLQENATVPMIDVRAYAQWLVPTK